jgi:hypothetical protein
VIDVARGPDVLIVSESPSALDRGVTWAWPLVALLACGVVQRVEESVSQPVTWALSCVALLVMLALRWNCRTRTGAAACGSCVY